MVDVRIMGDDPERVRQVAELMLPLLRSAVTLQVGDHSEVPNRRGPGPRIFFDVRPAQPVGPTWAHGERVVDDPAPRDAAPRAITGPSRSRPRGALPG